MLKVESSAFESSGPIPKKYTGEGQDISPPISWSGEPDSTQSFALICDDPDAPRDEPWVHWLLYNIPFDRHELVEDESEAGIAGENSWGNMAYGGPMPPPGHGTHHYHFKVYALDEELGLGPGADKKTLLEAVDGHVLEQGELIGTYER